MTLTDQERTAVNRLALQHADHFPWYKELLPGRGAKWIEDLAELPVVDHDLLLEHYYTTNHDHFTDAATYRTSGTASGTRKAILYAPDDEEAYVAQRKELFGSFFGTAAPGAVAVADLGTGHAAASARRIFAELGYEARDIDFTAPIDEHVAKLNEWQPEVLFTMPMILDRLMGSPELKFSPRKVAVVGDLAPANWRAKVAQFFGIGFGDVLDVFGSIEIGAIAFHNAETGLYHFHDHIVPEVDERGLLLLTSTTRRYFPALRYATNDLITGLRRITWQGKEVHAFDRIEGRFAGEVKHGERISNHDLCAAMAEVFPGHAFETVNDGALEIRVVTDEVTAGQVAEMRRLLDIAAPDVAQMIRSGLVGEIGVTAITPAELRSGGKRLLDVTGA